MWLPVQTCRQTLSEILSIFFPFVVWTTTWRFYACGLANKFRWQVVFFFLVLCIPSHFSSVRLFVTLWTVALQALPGCSVNEILQARILEWVTMPFSRGSSWPRDQTGVSRLLALTGGFFTTGATWEAQSLMQHPQICFYIGWLAMKSHWKLPSVPTLLPCPMKAWLVEGHFLSVPPTTSQFPPLASAYSLPISDRGASLICACRVRSCHIEKASDLFRWLWKCDHVG